MRADFYIYVLYRPWNGTPCYVGKGSGRRVKDHFRFGQAHYNQHLANIFKKAARLGTPIIYKKRYRGLTKATFAKKAYSPEWRAVHSAKTRAVVSGKKIPKPAHWVEQHRHRMLTKHTRPWLGRKHTPETKEKMRQAWVKRKQRGKA